MAKIRLIQEKRLDKDGKGAIKISVSQNGETAYIPVGVSVFLSIGIPRKEK